MRNMGWLWATVAVLLAAAALGARGLDADPLWDDEIRTYRNAGAVQYGLKSVSGVWQDVAQRTPDVPPGYAVLVALWGRAVGWSELGIRAFSWLAGLLAVALTARLGADLFSWRVGAMAALVLMSSVFFVHFMHEVRAFAMGMAFAVLVLLCYWRLIYQRPTWGTSLGLMTGALGVLHSHYFVALLLPVLATYHALFAPKTRRWWLPVGLAVPVVLLFAPVLPVFIDGLDDSRQREALQQMALTPTETLRELLLVYGNGYALLGLLALGGAFVALRRANNRRAVVFVLVMGVGLGLVVVGLNAVIKLLDPGRQRYFAGAWPALALSTALVFDALWRWRRIAGAAALAAWVIVGVWAMRPAGLSTRFDGADVAAWRDVHDIMQPHISGDDVIALHSPGLPWLAIPYFRHYTALFPARAELIESLETESVMRDYIADAERVWLTVYQRYPSEPQLATFEGVLDGTFIACEAWAAPEFEVRLLARSAAFCPGGGAIAQFAGGPALTGFTVDDTCTAYLGWRVPDDFPAYSFGVYVLGADGQVIAQADAGLPTPTYGYQRQSLIGVGAGTYTVGVGVYAWQTGERLLLADGNPLAQVGTLAVDNAGCVGFSP